MGSRACLYIAAFLGLSILFFGFRSCAHAAATDIYIAQNATGTANGADCNDAYAVSFFDTSSNWASTPTVGKISPGTTVHLCGTITAPGGTYNQFNFQDSGTAGDPITLQFDPTTGGNISLTTQMTGSIIALDGYNYITIIGHSSEGTSPDCQATQNGSPPLAYQNDFSCIEASGSSNVTVSNFGCANLYQHTSASDTAAPSDTTGCFHANPIGANVTIHDFTFHDADAGIIAFAGGTSGSANFNVYNGNLYNINHDVELVCGSATALSGVAFHDSQIHDPANWDTMAGVYHHDGLFVQGPGTGGCSSVYDYNNWYYGNWGSTGGTSPIFLDADVDTAIYVFNDVFTNTPTAADGITLSGNGTIFAYNNTGISGSTGGLGLKMTNVVDMRNNVLTGYSTFVQNAGSGFSIAAMDYNAYANLYPSGNQAFYFNSSSSNGSSLTSQFSSWQGIVQALTPGSESHSVTTSSANLNSYGVPQAGSFVIGAGVNLCNGIVSCTGNLAALANDTSLGNTRTPTARPSTGAWDIGAYQYTTSTPASTFSLSLSGFLKLLGKVLFL